MPREINVILKNMSSWGFISICLEYYLMLNSYHTQINITLEINYLTTINAKYDVYSVCSLTLANKLLIEICLLNCCAVFEFIQAVPLEVISLERRPEIHCMSKYYTGWLLTQFGIATSELKGPCFHSLFTETLHWQPTEIKKVCFPPSVLNITSITGNIRLPLSDMNLIFSYSASFSSLFITHWSTKRIMSKVH